MGGGLNLFPLNLLAYERIPLLCLGRKSQHSPLSCLNEDYVRPPRMAQVDKPWVWLEGVRGATHQRNGKLSKKVVFGVDRIKKAEILNCLTELLILKCSSVLYNLINLVMARVVIPGCLLVAPAGSA